MDEKKLIQLKEIQNKIFTLRGIQVMLDKDLAILYRVKTKRLNEQVKRNAGRFPEDFVFQLTKEEKMVLVAKCDHLKNLKFSSTLPYAFTEQGVAMLSSVLKSKRAEQISIKIMRAFVAMRHFIKENAHIFQRLDRVELKQMKFENDMEKVLNAIESGEIKKKQGIFFNGQIFEAHNFISNLIRSADKSIILIDNFIDDSVLINFSKKEKVVRVTIYTKKISKKLKLDAKKFNKQYPFLELREIKNFHDRFLIIDYKQIYHIGASLKDLGKKCFAFSKLLIDVNEILKNLD